MSVIIVFIYDIDNYLNIVLDIIGRIVLIVVYINNSDIVEGMKVNLIENDRYKCVDMVRIIENIRFVK